MRRHPIIWLLVLLTLLMAVFQTGDLEHVREVVADGTIRQFDRLDLDGIVSSRDLDEGEVVQTPGAPTVQRSSPVRVMESLLFAAPQSWHATANVSPAPAPVALLPRAPLSITFPLPTAERCGIETRGPPPRSACFRTSSLRAPPRLTRRSFSC